MKKVVSYLKGDPNVGLNYLKIENVSALLDVFTEHSLGMYVWTRVNLD